MSKSTKKPQKSGRNYLVLGIVVVGMILLIVAGVMLSKGGNESGVPSLFVDEELVNFGEVKLGTPLTFKITVTNQGDGTLRFLKKPYIDLVEGC